MFFERTSAHGQLEAPRVYSNKSLVLRCLLRVPVPRIAITKWSSSRDSKNIRFLRSGGSLLTGGSGCPLPPSGGTSSGTNGTSASSLRRDIRFLRSGGTSASSLRAVRRDKRRNIRFLPQGGQEEHPFPPSGRMFFERTSGRAHGPRSGFPVHLLHHFLPARDLLQTRRRRPPRSTGCRSSRPTDTADAPPTPSRPPTARRGGSSGR